MRRRQNRLTREPANTTKTEPARFDVQAADARSTSAPGEAGATDDELARLRTATRLAFAVVAGLLIALVATLLMMFGRRRRADEARLAAKARQRRGVHAGSLRQHRRRGRTAAPDLCAGDRPRTRHRRSYGVRQSVGRARRRQHAPG